MKAKKQLTKGHAQLEKVLTLAGVTLVLVGCIANLYGTYYNLRFIHDSIDFIYYLRYLFLIGGGFAVGYLYTHKSSEYKGHTELFGGVFYAVLAMALYWLIDLLRVGIQNVSYPWAQILFEGAPLLAIVGVLVVAYISRQSLKHSAVSPFAKVLLIVAFSVYQVFYLLSSALAQHSTSVPPWVILSNYALSPLVIALVAFILLKNVKALLNRLFYAVLIGNLFSILYVVLWELHTNPSYEATNTFSIVVMLLTLAFTGALLWRAYKVVR